MKTMKMTVSYGSKEKGNAWELKDVEYQIPGTVEEWVSVLTAEKVVLALETFDQIRRQDAARRAHVGGKNISGLSDKRIREEVVPNFKLFERTRIAAQQRDPKEAILAQSADKAKADLAALCGIKKDA